MMEGAPASVGRGGIEAPPRVPDRHPAGAPPPLSTFRASKVHPCYPAELLGRTLSTLSQVERNLPTPRAARARLTLHLTEWCNA